MLLTIGEIYWMWARELNAAGLPVASIVLSLQPLYLWQNEKTSSSDFTFPAICYHKTQTGMFIEQECTQEGQYQLKYIREYG